MRTLRLNSVLTALFVLGLGAVPALALDEVDLDAPGDNLLTRDLPGGFDWLDATVTVDLSYDQVIAGEGGWTGRGFLPAGESELCALLAAEAFAPNPCPGEDPVVGDPSLVKPLLQALGGTVDGNDNGSLAATFDDGGSVPGKVGLLQLSVSSGVGSVQVSRGAWGSSEADPAVGHLLVRKHVTIYGRPGSFGTIESCMDGTPRGCQFPIHAEGIEGFAPSPGQSLYTSVTASDGTMLMANVHQSFNQTLPTSCDMVVTCFNPDEPLCWDEAAGAAAHFSNLRIENAAGSEWAPPGSGPSCDSLVFGEALGGDVGDLVAIERNGEERIVGVGVFPSISALALAGPSYPAWVEVAKESGSWRVDQSASLFATDLRDSNPPVSHAACTLELPVCFEGASWCPQEYCSDAGFAEQHPWARLKLCEFPCATDAECPAEHVCDEDLCKRVDCGGLNEMARLPASGHIVAVRYTGHFTQLDEDFELAFLFGAGLVGQGITVLAPDGTIEASFDVPSFPENPCYDPSNPNSLEFIIPLVREVQTDPTSALGDERFTVVYDTNATFERGQLVQEFSYRAAEGGEPAAIVPITQAFIPKAPSAPAVTCEGPPSGSGIEYDADGNLWILTNPALIYFRDESSGTRPSLEGGCSYLVPETGEERPFAADCPADLDTGPMLNKKAEFGFNPFFLDIVQDPWSGEMLTAGGSVGSIRRTVAESGAVLWSSGPNMPLLRGLPLETHGLLPWGSSFHPLRREVFIPMGRGISGPGGGAPPVGVEADAWVYRVGVDTILETGARLLSGDAPASGLSGGENPPISLTVNFGNEGSLHGVSGLYITRNDGLVLADSWGDPPDCAEDGSSCTFTAALPPSATVGLVGMQAWHALIQFGLDRLDRLHVAGRIELSCPEGSAGDSDADGVVDCIDNCTQVANADQRDTDSDGYGNRCDADFDNNNVVGFSDYKLLAALWGMTSGDPGYDPDVDLDGNGRIGISDFINLFTHWGRPPGPSGLICAGSVPCPASITDIDTDGVEDSADNCVSDWNPDQCDANADGYGNRCDADFDDDGVAGISDFILLSQAFRDPGSLTSPELDIDCDGDLDKRDVYLFLLDRGQSPGPSGLSCAGSTPCP